MTCAHGKSSTGPAATGFYLYGSTAAMGSDFTDLMTQESVQKTANFCPALGWRPYQDDGAPTVNVGNLASYNDKGTSTAQLAWTDNPRLILSIAAKPTSASAQAELCTWWESSDRTVSPARAGGRRRLPPSPAVARPEPGTRSRGRPRQV